MSDEAKIKAANLRKLGADLVNLSSASLPNAKTTLENISVGFPGFSVLGLALHFAHEVLKNQSGENIQKAQRTMEAFQQGLADTAATWNEADDMSSATITY